MDYFLVKIFVFLLQLICDAFNQISAKFCPCADPLMNSKQLDNNLCNNQY